MILKGSQRGGARQLAAHLLKVEENEHVEIHEISGFISEDLDGALREIYAISRGTRCKQFMFSLSLNPPEKESVPVECFEKTLTDIEKDLDLKGQPRVIVFHEKEGRRHCHAVWSRIDPDEMKAINLPYFKMKLQDISRQLYFQYGWHMPRGLMNKEERNPLNFTLAEWQQAKRLKEDPKVIKKLFQDCWAVSDSKASFEKVLTEYGYYLAKGDRRGFVAIDYRGEVFSLGRWIGLRSKELNARLGKQENLLGTKEVKAQIAQRMRPLLKDYIRKVKDSHEDNLTPYRQKKAALQNYHRTERKDLLKRQEERENKEEKKRLQRLPKGFKAVWARLTGKYKKIKAQNEREAERCKARDKNEKQVMIDRQLTDRQNLQDQVHPILRKHQKLIIQLKKDVPKYMEMDGRSQKALQEKLDQMNRDEQRQVGLVRDQGYTLEI